MDVLIVLGINVVYFYLVYIVLRVVILKKFEGIDFFEISFMFIFFIFLGKYLEVLVKGKILVVIVKFMDLVFGIAILLSFDGGGNIINEKDIDSRLI